MTLSSDENLSDKSFENDAFFEQPLNATRRILSNQIGANTKRKDNLSDIKEETDFEFEMSRLKPSASSTPRISNDDGSDDEDLGFDPKKPKATSSKLDFFDDILGGALGETNRPATASAAAPLPAARRRGDEQPQPRPAVSRQSTDTTTDNSTVQRPKTSTGRRGSGLSTTINNPDPLGLFSQSTKEAQQSSNALNTAKKRGSTADWLGLSVAAEPIEYQQQNHAEPRAESPKTPRSKSVVSQTQVPAYEILKLKNTLGVQDALDATVMANEPVVSAGTVDLAAQSIMQLNNMNLETRSAFNMLQQQESQLTLAAQMKQQERALIEMQRRQETLLHQQERQFQSLIHQQMQRQHNLEESIKTQQQRINAHIQLMLTQPATALNLCMPVAYEEPSAVASTEVFPDELTARNVTHAVSQTTLDRIQIETDSRRLELEKLRLEELVANTKSNYEREIEVIEATYKKQIKLLDEHAETLELRLRAEISSITEYYKEKIEMFEAEHHKSKSNWETEITTLKQDHEDELRKLRKTHEEDLDILRDEQRRMLETVQRTKLLELAAVQDNSSYLDTLKAASANLNEATTDLQSLKEQLQIKLETANQQKQQTLEARERLLADKERRLQMCEASAEQEKTRLMKLVANLEQQLSALNKETSEENWQLRLKLSALEAEKVAFEREREYAREQLQRDEQRLAALKAEQIAEMQRIKLELQEERRQLQLEKTKFETQQKLRTNSSSGGLEKDRCDLEVAMKCAQEAARQAEEERQRYFTQQLELEQLKREIVDRETQLRAKQEQLNMELKACAAAEQQSKDAAKRSRIIEQNLQEKLQTMQQRTRELAEKEAFIAEERQLLAQQRLAIKDVQQRLTQRQCAACQQLASGSSHNSPKIENANKTTLDAPPLKSPMYVVDRLLDDNIAESLKRLQASIAQQQTSAMSSADILSQTVLQQSGYTLVPTNLNLWPTLPPTGLDDDSKTLALNNFDQLQFEIGLIKSAAESAANESP